MPDFNLGEFLTGLLGGADGADGANSAFNRAASLGLGATGLAFAKDAYDDIGQLGREAYEGLAGEEGLAQELRGMMEFQPYTVTSATGGQFGMMQDPETGQMTYQLDASPEERAFQEQALTDASSFFTEARTPIAQREQAVYDRMRAAMSPEEERQRLALEQRMAAQGRSGVRTAQFGGTPEQLTLAKAQEEARNSAMLSAMQFAGQEQQRQAQLGTGMLAAGYVPQSQLLNALQPGMAASERRRQAMSEQAGAYGETYTSGLEALLQSGLGQAGLAGGFGSSLASTALGGLFSK